MRLKYEIGQIQRNPKLSGYVTIGEIFTEVDARTPPKTGIARILRDKAQSYAAVFIRNCVTYPSFKSHKPFVTKI